jgi:TetR/AcrR family transcriptional regulator, transcriptional repressor for nem operon
MPLGRPRQYDREAVLDAAMHVFWSKGYEATSMQDLMDSMQLSKSSLYQAFGSKHNLFLLCIQRYHKLTMADMRQRLARSETGLDFIAETLRQVIAENNELANPRGCLVTNTATEFAQSDSAIAISVSSGLKGYQAVFRAAASKGQADGSVDGKWVPDVLAQFLVNNMNGLRTMVKAGTDQASLQKMVDVIVDTVR